ncbi:MAG: hypothetical protein OEQ53_14525, partial [Saprospiraceae bacterium]|nr:hypothetical protein [Saprospiraceae bacterium]
HGVHVSSGGPLAIFLDGGVRQRGSDSMMISLPQDSLQLKKLRMAIKEKNRLHRWRLRPLNEAYIFLFRRHEMGHLAYEMEDYAALVTEKEDEIARLAQPGTYHVNIELIKPWQPPKNYPEDEVPAHVPEPDIAQELEAFHIADGFEVNLFAADPMIANPINLNWDTRGRAWVATSSTYPHIEPGREPSDRIVLLEDSDGDGQADRSIVFAEGLLVPHSVMPVPGGAYVTSTTEFLFLADTNGDDVADERRVVFDGFGNADVHHMIHGLRWAPWGGLYFIQSIYINSFVETAYGPRRLNGTGIWHFHPETEQLEVFSRGLINPWGHAFDQWGQSFTTDGAGSSGINYIFPESAHATAVGAARILQGLNAGTPKNTAAEVVYSQHLPREWQGSILTNDFRANRTVRYEIVPEGSGYRAKEVETVLHSDHRSYRPVDTKIGPDGAVYIVDWYNPIIDHGEVDFHHPIRDKSHGRIWRLTNQKRPLLPRSNLHQASISALLNALKSTEYYTRVQANRELVARQCDPKILQSWFRSLPRSHPDFELHRLEALWLGAALQYYDGSLMDETLRSKNPHARAAALRMVKHWNMQPEKMDQLGVMIHDPHPQVRLEAIHTLRSFPTLQTASIVMESLDHPMDANLEYATWFSARDMQQVWLPAMREGVEVFENDVNRQMYALLACEEAHVISLVQDRISNPEVKDTLVNQAWTMMAQLGDASALAMVLEETVKTNNYRLLSSLANAPIANEAIPHNLDLLEEFLDHDNPDVQITAAKLVGRWKAERYLELLKRMFSDPSTSVELRMSTGKALIELGQIKFVRDNATKGTDLSVRAAASAVWAGKEPRQAVESVIDLLVDIEDDADAELLFLTYRNMEDGPDILAKKLSQVKLSESVASVGLRIAQTSGLNLTDLETAIRKAGSLAPVGTQMNHSQRTRLIEEALKSGNRYRGSQVYRRPQLLCATCHRIDGIGGLIGPDLTTLGSYMTPGSILESLLQPNSDVKQGYETVIATLADGQVVSGTLHRKADDATMIRMANNEIRSIPNAELEKLDVSEASLMPAGLTASLHRDELKDLLYFLSNLGVEN